MKYNNKKIIIIAFDINPYMGSEAQVAFSWVKILNSTYKIVVYTDSRHKKRLRKINFNNTEFVYIDNKERIIKYANKLGAYNIQYFIFIKKVKKLIKEVIKVANDITLISCLTPAGIHSYNDFYKFNIPMLIGPVGGGIGIPSGFARCKTIRDILKEGFYYCIRKSFKWKKYFINSEKIIIGTKKMKEILPDEVLSKTVQIFDTCVDTERFTPEKAVSYNMIKIIYVGRLEKFKGCFILLECFNKLIKKGYNNITLSIAGCGREKKRMEKYILKNSLNNHVNMLGNVNYENMPKILNRHHIFCLPTLKEPGGTAILEAMACGLAIITSDAAGPSESVGDDCGIKVKLSNYREFSNGIYNALEYMIKNYYCIGKMGEAARKRVIEKYSNDALKEKILKVYSQVLGCENKV